MPDTPVGFPRDARPGPFDPPEVLKRLREENPLVPMRFADGHVGWLVTGYAAVRSVLSDPRFSARPELAHLVIDVPAAQVVTGMRLSGPGMFVLTDPPEHTRYRKLLISEFTVRRMARLEPRIAEITRSCLDAMEEAGPPVDLVEAFAFPIPSRVICELLGIPYADREEFERAMNVMVGYNTGQAQAAKALDTVLGFFPPLIERRRKEPTDDMFSGLVNSGQLSDKELATIGYILFAGGLETTANMLSLGSFALLQHPEQMEALRRDPHNVGTAVEELLRYLTIGQFGPQRTALEDVEVEGTLIKKGQAVMVSLPAANRDPARFDDPDTLDITRPAHGHIAFGHGFHQCLGQQLARAEMRHAFPALLERFPDLRLAVPADEVPTREDMYIYGVHRLPVAW